MTDQEKLAEKVAQASETELVVLMLEGVQNRLQDGKAAIAENKPEELNTAVEKIRAILGELLATLWGDSEVAIQSRQIYFFVNKLVTDGANRQAKEPLEEAEKVLQPLLEGWRHIAVHPQTEMAPTNGPSIVAGMTYGKGTLNENVMNSGNRLGKG